MELSTYLRPLKRWWWLLLASTVLAAASSVLYVRQQRPTYVARTTLMIGRAFENPNPTGSELALGQQLAETYADLAYRRPVREQTMAALGLKSLPEYNAYLLPNRPLLEISVVDTNPQRAKAVADELANQLTLQSPTSPKPEDQERAAFVNDQLTRLQANIRQTESELAAKQGELESALGALELSKLQSEVAALQTKLSTLQSNYAALLANTKDGAINSIEVIEAAAVPTAPTDSGKMQLVLIASAIGLALAVGTAYLLDYLDDTVRTTEDLTRVNGFASLASIPEFQWEDGRSVPVLAQHVPRLPGTDVLPRRPTLLHGATANRRGIPVLAQAAPRSLATDVFRALRTGLYAATANKPGKIFLITSSAPKEGKSTIAANLAAVLAQGEKRVLLVDADLHRPSQHKLFDVPGDYGLAELLLALKGHGQPNGAGEMIERAIKKIEPMHLGLIVAGSHLDDAGRLLGSDAMKVLLETVSRDVDYVLVDSPPVLAVSDALMLSTQVDGVVVVASAGLIPRRQLEQTLRRLSEVNANVLGLVLNRQKADPNHRYDYYRSYMKQD